MADDHHYSPPLRRHEQTQRNNFQQDSSAPASLFSWFTQLQTKINAAPTKENDSNRSPAGRNRTLMDNTPITVITSPSQKPLRLASWNCNSIHRKQHELHNFITNNDIDIMCLQETWLKPNNRLNFPHYTIHRHDRVNRRSGGVAILVKSAINQSALNIVDIDVIENIGIKHRQQRNIYF